MKQFNIKTMLAAAIMAVGLASCSTSDDPETSTSGASIDNNSGAPIEFKLAKTVEMNCSSDDVVLGE